jgi:transposase-like protein
MALKLTIELVPKTTWYANLRNSLTKEEWNQIRKDCYKKAGHKCEICGREGMLNCHEVWEFDNSRNIQKLKRFIALCELCHNIKHMGFVNVRISRGIWPESVRDELARHFMKVNGVSREEFEKCVEEAFTLWEERSKRRWKLDFGIYSAAYKQGQTRLFKSADP